MQTKRQWILSAAALAVSTLGGIANAQDFPTKPITIIVPFPPGGIADSSVRAIGTKMTESTGQPVIVDNRAGAGGQIGASVVKQAKADGYTLFLANVGTHGINRSLYNKLSYDPVKDFEPVTPLFGWTHVLVVPSDSPIKSVADLVQQAKANPGKLTFASQGIGSGGHLLAESFKSISKTESVHVPYRGTAQVMPDLLSGRVSYFFDGVGILPFIKEGKVRALAVTDTKRLNLLPNVPTMAEAGVPGVELSAWFGIVAPAGTPKAVVARLNQELVKAAHAPAIVKQLGETGINVITSSPEQFAGFMAAETERLGKIVKASGATAE